MTASGSGRPTRRDAAASVLQARDQVGRDEFVTEFLEGGLLGFYLAVAREGEVAAGDPIVDLQRDPRGFRVTEVARLFAGDRGKRRAHASCGRP